MPASALTFHLVALLYSGAAMLFFVDLARADRPETSKWSLRLLQVGLAVHGVHLAMGVARATVPAWSLKFALSLCAVSLVSAYLVLRRSSRLHAMGVVVAPLSLALVVGAEFLQGKGPISDFPRTLLLMHVAANVLGVGLFLLAGAASGFYLWEERRLKDKRGVHLGGKLPPLDALDLTEHRLLLAGFPLLTFGIVSGAVFTARLDVMTGAAIARSLLGYATWILVAGVLVLRAVAGWRGRRAAYGTIAGVACVLVVIGIYVAQSGRGGGL